MSWRNPFALTIYSLFASATLALVMHFWSAVWLLCIAVFVWVFTALFASFFFVGGGLGYLLDQYRKRDRQMKQ